MTLFILKKRTNYPKQSHSAPNKRQNVTIIIFYWFVFIDWLIPEAEETFEHFVRRMAEPVDVSEKFSLLGYSFGGILVQEIHKLKPAEQSALRQFKEEVERKLGRELEKIMLFGSKAVNQHIN